MKIEGESAKPWTVWRVSPNGEQIERIAQANTRKELEYKPRADWHYGTFHKSERVD
jgi:hypothetical protein